MAAQIAGGITGSIVANLMFELDAVSWSSHSRSTGGLWLAEVVATVGLLTVIFGVVRSGRTNAAPFAVGAYIGAAYFFTSSTSFANPAVTIGRAFTDTFAGIEPSSVPFRRVPARRCLRRRRADPRAVPRRSGVADHVIVPHEEVNR